MSLLKSKFNLCILNIPKDFKISQGDIYSKLLKDKFKELTPSQEYGYGWAHVGDLFKEFTMEDIVVVNSVVGGFRYDRKKVPGVLLKKLFSEKCAKYITANIEKCESNIEKSLALSTLLVPELGYDISAQIAEEAYKTGKTIREIVLEREILNKKILDKIFKVIS